GGAARQLAAELDALRFAAAELRRRLADANVAEADVFQRLQLRQNRRNAAEAHARLADRHVEHVGNRLALVFDLQRLAVVARAVADFTRDVDVRQELHLDLKLALTLAVLAAATFDVEAEATGGVATDLAFRQVGEQLANA